MAAFTGYKKFQCISFLVWMPTTSRRCIMKTIHDHRTRARNHFDTPIFWIDKRTKKKYKGRICNISEKGLYVESNDAHQGGSDITVGVPGTPDTEPAHLVWNREIINKKIPTFGFGFEFSKPRSRWGEITDSFEKPINRIKSTLKKIYIKQADIPPYWF
jgi:hypothetical protein